VLVQFSLAREFKNEEYAFGVVEVAEEFEDVGVGEVRLDFDFTADLSFYASTAEFALVQDFQRADET
jgi:hypothetical protein